jgi:hypothetical protein
LDKKVDVADKDNVDIQIKEKLVEMNAGVENDNKEEDFETKR